MNQGSRHLQSRLVSSRAPERVRQSTSSRATGFDSDDAFRLPESFEEAYSSGVGASVGRTRTPGWAFIIQSPPSHPHVRTGVPLNSAPRRDSGANIIAPTRSGCHQDGSGTGSFIQLRAMFDFVVLWPRSVDTSGIFHAIHPPFTIGASYFLLAWTTIPVFLTITPNAERHAMSTHTGGPMQGG